MSIVGSAPPQYSPFSTNPNWGGGPSPYAPPAPGPTGTTGPVISSGQQRTPTEQELANEVFDEYATEIGTVTQQQEAAVGGLKIQEAQIEGGITASAAARGLKVGSGSELSKMVSQQNAGAEAINYQENQGAAALSGIAQEQNVALGRAEINATLTLQQQQAQQTQQQSNMWLTAFSMAES